MAQRKKDFFKVDINFEGMRKSFDDYDAEQAKERALAKHQFRRLFR